MSLNRRVAPEFQRIQQVHFPPLHQIALDNQQPLYIINVGQQPVVRIEVLFEAGTWHEQREGSSFFAVKMLSEGTTHRSSAQISEALDQVGAFLELSHTPDRANVMVYALVKQLPAVLAVLRDLIMDSIFPVEEFENLRNITRQNLRINLQKNAFVASNTLKEQIFGPTHPYGLYQHEASIEALKREDLEEFYQQRIKHRPFRVFLSGMVTPESVALVNQFLGQHSVEENTAVVAKQLTGLTPQQYHLEKPDALQSSVRVGRQIVRRQHPDFYKLLVANELLGGFFGSRLMKNIREEKGFTYGISSNLIPLRRDAYWVIGTDVKKEFAQATLNEIKHEIEQIQQTQASEAEIETVKNYMAGAFAGGLNTPFEIADRVRLMVLEGLETDYYEQHIQRLRAVSPQQIQEVAQRYWQWDDLHRVIIG